MINQLDRVAILKDFIVNGVAIKAGTLGTVRSFVGNDSLLVQYDFTDGSAKYVGVPSNLVRHAKPAELKEIRPDSILPQTFHIGTKYAVNLGNVGSIVNVKIEDNETQDVFELAFPDGTVDEYDRMFLENKASRVMFENIPQFPDNDTQMVPDEDDHIEYQSENTEVSGTDTEPLIGTPKDNFNETDIKIIVDGYEFDVVAGPKADNHILMFPQHGCSLDEIGGFATALLKIKNLLKL